MEPPRQKLFARLALLAFTIFGALWLTRLDYAEKISTNVVDLIPADERAPELALVRDLTDQQQARVLLFALAGPSTATDPAAIASSSSPNSPPSTLHPLPSSGAASAPFPFASYPAPSPEATAAFAASLKKSPALADVVVLGDTSARDALGRFIFTRRLDLLLPTWLEEKHRIFQATTASAPSASSATPVLPSTLHPLPSSASTSASPAPPSLNSQPSTLNASFSSWLAEQTALDLDTFLARPESVAFQELIPRDPLLLVPSLVGKIETLASSALNSQPSTLNSSASGPALIWAVVKDSPFSDAGQDPVFAAIDAALADAKKIMPGAELRWTGINRFAAESKARIKAEILSRHTLSLLGVLIIVCLFVRRLWKILHLIPVVILSTLGGLVFTTMIFDRVHVLVFVIGSILAGVAIDYGFYLYMQPSLRPDEPYRSRLGRLLKPLLTSCLTTVIGFSLLFWSDLPLVRQLGVFVSAGLVSALIVAILYFAQLDRAFLETRALVIPAALRSRRVIVPLFILAALIAVIGPWKLHWRDDIRELEIPAPALRANDEEVRRLFGDAAERTAYLTRGDTPAAARAALDRFTSWHDAQFPAAPAASAGFIIPTEAAWNVRTAHLAALPAFPADLRAALEQHGYSADSFAPFFEAWSTLTSPSSPPLNYQPSTLNSASISLPSTVHPLPSSDSSSSPSPLAPRPSPSYSSLFTDLRRELTGPLSLLFHLDPAGGPSWFLSLADHPPGATPPAELNTFSVAQLESLNTLFSRYRADAARLSAIGLALLGASVFVIYGFKRGIRIFLIPAGSCLFALGLLGLCGQTLNIFHLLAAFLGVCLSHNYAIFSAENIQRHEPPPPSIRLSALCTAVVFGALALSKIPVVAALGATVALIVITALLMVELEPLGRSEGKAHRP
jgi:predicted exporter